MKTKSLASASLMAMAALSFSTYGHAKTLKVGLIYSLSGPAAVLGEQSRDGFMLALEELNNKLGGLDVEVIVRDDKMEPSVAVTEARRLVERDKVDFVVGPIFANVAQAIAKPITDAGVFMISTTAGPSQFAGSGCHRNLFVNSYQDDQVFEVIGKYAQDEGYKRAYFIVPNYQAGKDAVSGFKQSYQGEVIEETYVPLGQLDYSAELTQIAAARPDAVLAFMPGGMGINFVKQYRQAGLDSIPMLSTFTVDESTLPALQDSAVDLLAGSNWAPDLDNAPNKKFTADYIAKYKSVPATYAVFAYDAAKIIDAAVTATGGNLDDKDALRRAIENVSIQSPRGDFRFGANHFPIQDFYLTKVIERPDGLYATSYVKTIFTDYVDRYAQDCKL